MSVQPYVLETLYRHGTIDFVPYDLYSPISAGNASNNQQQNLTGNNGAIQNIQMQELQSMSQAPITTHPKKPVNIAGRTSVQANYNLSNGNSQINSYNYQDSFTTSNSLLGTETGSVVNEIRGLRNNTIPVQNNPDSFRSSLISDEEKQKIAHPHSNSKLWPKALISVAAITLALLAIFKRGGSATTAGGSFWSKLNPLNWFK